MFPIIDPAIIQGITLTGSDVANGIAPSVIPTHPINSEALPESLSSLLNFWKQ